jgi:1-acyl-sn-glycerol-3-phosphate acyltransferase
MRILKNISFLFRIAISLIPIGKFGKMIDAYRREGNHEKERETIRKVAGYWTPKVLAQFHVVTHVEGLEHIPEGAVLFASNHQGYGDIFILLAEVSCKQIGFFAKESLRRIPIFGKWIARVRSLFLARSDLRSTLEVFKQGEEWLKDGFSFVIFPEGTRSRSEQMNRFKKGSLRPAIKAGVPIVPVSINGTWHLFEEKGYVRKGEVNLCIHPAIETSDLSKAEEAGLSDRVEEIIRTKIDEWNAEAREPASKN